MSKGVSEELSSFLHGPVSFYQSMFAVRNDHTQWEWVQVHIKASFFPFLSCLPLGLLPICKSYHYFLSFTFSLAL